MPQTPKIAVEKNICCIANYEYNVNKELKYLVKTGWLAKLDAAVEKVETATSFTLTPPSALSSVGARLLGDRT